MASKKYTYDYKRLTVALKWHNIYLDNIEFDTSIAAYLLEYNLKDDIAYLANEMGYNIPFREMLYPKKGDLDLDLIRKSAVAKAKYIYETKDRLIDELKEKDMYELFTDIEMPLSLVLGDMEYTGFNVNKDILREMGKEIKEKIDLLAQEI